MTICETSPLQQASCLVNPRAGYETSLNLKPAAPDKRKRIAVVGSGPAGLAAATGCAERGHSVTLFEGAGALGGQVREHRVEHEIMNRSCCSCAMPHVCSIVVQSILVPARCFCKPVFAGGCPRACTLERQPARVFFCREDNVRYCRAPCWGAFRRTMCCYTFRLHGDGTFGTIGSSS